MTGQPGELAVIIITILAALFVAFLPTLVAMRNRGPWFIIFIANLVAPMTGIGWLALLYIAMRRR